MHRRRVQLHWAYRDQSLSVAMDPLLSRVRATAADCTVQQYYTADAKKGRMDVRAVLQDAVTAAHNRDVKVIAVGVCGPASLAEEVKRACASSTFSGVRFHVHDESFEF
jgi:hypothetical protein